MKCSSKATWCHVCWPHGRPPLSHDLGLSGGHSGITCQLMNTLGVQDIEPLLNGEHGPTKVQELTNWMSNFLSLAWGAQGKRSEMGGVMVCI